MRIRVMPKAGISDPEGNAILDAAHHLGHGQIVGVHAGKAFELEGAYDSLEEAEAAGLRIGAELLANPVIETFEVVSVEELG